MKTLNRRDHMSERQAQPVEQARNRRTRRLLGRLGSRSVRRTLLVSVFATTSASGVLAVAAGAATPTVHENHSSGSHVVLTDMTTSTYTVQWGDTLSAIAERFATTVAALAAANGIGDPNLIYTGQVLAISGAAPQAPAAPANPTSYTVQPGDTLSAIAARFATTVGALAAANGIGDPNLIYAGQVLALADGGATSAPATTPSTPSTPTTVAAVAPAATTVTLLSTMPSSVQATFACIVQAESGGNPEAVNPSSGTMGLLQFMESTWLDNGGGAYASTPLEATPNQQMNIGVRTYEADGWAPWSTDSCF